MPGGLEPGETRPTVAGRWTTLNFRLRETPLSQVARQGVHRTGVLPVRVDPPWHRRDGGPKIGSRSVGGLEARRRYCTPSRVGRTPEPTLLPRSRGRDRPGLADESDVRSGRRKLTKEVVFTRSPVVTGRDPSVLWCGVHRNCVPHRENSVSPLHPSVPTPRIPPGRHGVGRGPVNVHRSEYPVVFATPLRQEYQVPRRRLAYRVRPLSSYRTLLCSPPRSTTVSDRPFHSGPD